MNKSAKDTRNNSRRTGFTVVELMIATTVFSIILILSLTGFLQIGQMFYKGVNITNTTNTANQVINTLKTDIAYKADTTVMLVQEDNLADSPIGPVTRKYFCAGSNRYSYILGKQVDREAEAEEMKTIDPSGWYKFGLLKDKVAAQTCPKPFSSPAVDGQIDPDEVEELIGDKMRLSFLFFHPGGKTLYTLLVHIAYGDDDVLDDPTTPGEDPTSPNAKCKSGAANSTYCFVTDMRTTARRGFLP